MKSYYLISLFTGHDENIAMSTVSDAIKKVGCTKANIVNKKVNIVSSNLKRKGILTAIAVYTTFNYPEDSTHDFINKQNQYIPKIIARHLSHIKSTIVKDKDLLDASFNPSHYLKFMNQTNLTILPRTQTKLKKSAHVKCSKHIKFLRTLSLLQIFR